MREWVERAACRGADPQIFEQPRLPSNQRARARWTNDWAEPALEYCRVCPVVTECRNEALRPLGADEHRAPLVMGGLVPDDIRKLRGRTAYRG